jgi:protein yieJ
VACCDDYCAFLGDVGTKELEELGIADEVFDDYVKRDEYDVKMAR